MTPHRVWRTCPYCDEQLTFIGTFMIVMLLNNADAQADRFDCANGHTFLVVETERIEE